MQFEPIAGFPPIIREDDANISEKTLESRGFATTNIVKIADIMKSKKIENLSLGFGPDVEEGAVDFMIQALFDDKPHEYEGISYKSYKNIPKKYIDLKK